ncbi:PREDICTED: uncharacterized acetyltransferase At3g50280 [Theobroma cacao]|uniref:Uncharacterized acetyltransferase At3g50280 n=1 Tax=Theobroma cacao TaxID=3641 RepID=A0AB32UXW6_THECC|nr:PREDICTED: uncharacterized acetyltransferase At3g50280 [Theobroma cacao]
MGYIQFISNSIVRAANPKKEVQRIELAPWDLMFLAMDYAPKGLLYYKLKLKKEGELGETIVHQLKTSLSQTLDYFSPLAGRLATIELEDNTSSFFIDCNNAGVLFVHAAANGITISDIIGPSAVPSFVRTLFQLNEVKNYESTSQPLLAIQVTELADGIFISCTYNHVVVDGTSFVHFFNCWAEISRGSIELAKPPALQRWFPNGIEGPVGIPNSYLTYGHDFIPPCLQVRFFHFTKASIANLKAKANAEVGTDKISSLQALLSHIWRTVIRCKNLDPVEETNFFLPVSAKSRLYQLSQQYIGNAMQGKVITMKVKDLLEKGLGNAAWEINKSIASQSEEKMTTFLESWKESPLLLTAGLASTVSNLLVLGGSPRFDYYSVDFGWGRPIAIRSGVGNKHDGKITVYGGLEEGSMDIEACFIPETLQALANCKEFMNSVATQS